ncbi:MAG: SRPBCC domain-containing protein [Bacteroidales bacterium]|nr:SRPBCC domain-containing protein [Bacteroidales bacterium]
MQTIKQHFKIKATPEEIFNAITNPLAIELWSGYPAIMEPKEDTEFSLWDGDITGKNLKMIPNEQIIQEWYFGEQEDKSIVTITLRNQKGSTYIELVHTNVPDNDYEELLEGWREYYWGAVKKYFE